MTRTALALLAAVALAPAAPVPKPVPKPPHPTAVGAKWQYVFRGDERKVGVIELAKAEEKDGKTELTMPLTFPDGRVLVERFVASAEGVWLLAQDDMTYDPPVLRWKVGAKTGDTWTEKYVGGTTRYEVEFKVGKTEEITAPVGKITATPVTMTYAGDPRTHVSWYADGIGLVRSTSSEQKQPVWELKSFTPAAAKK